MKRIFLATALSLSLAGCSLFGNADLNPPQQAYALNKEYQVAAHAALSCKKLPACWEKAGDAIQAADAVAFDYVESTTEQAKDWNDAPANDKPAELSAFQSIFALAKAAIGKLAGLI